MKQNPIIPLIIIFFLISSGLLNIALWYKDIGSIYGLVFGIVSLILAWFVFHFRQKE
ncbi:MAG: hypothetical protein ACI88H_001659 [Cocleimonas sp.]|jgi:hypothetical protein